MIMMISGLEATASRKQPCKTCGHELDADWVRCPYCSTWLHPPKVTPAPQVRPKLLALYLLGLLIIGLGIGVGIGLLWPHKQDQAPLSELVTTISTSAPDFTSTPRPTDIIAPTAAFTPAPTLGIGTTLVSTQKPSATPTPAPASTLTPPPPSPGATLFSDVDDMELVYVPAGEFLMGSVDSDRFAYWDEKPQHTVYLDTFWIDRTEVTNAMYAAFLNERSNQAEGKVPWLDADDEDALIVQENGQWVPKSGYEVHPVIEVTWYGAQAYCEWAGRRLPVEAEWEKAARGTNGKRYPWGSTYPLQEGPLPPARDCDLAQFDGCSGDTVPVSSNPAGASPYGALNMAGNAWEWVADWYDTNYYESSPTENPQGPSSGNRHIVRGGSWSHSGFYIHTAARYGFAPIVASDLVGFRCARSP